MILSKLSYESKELITGEDMSDILLLKKDSI